MYESVECIDVFIFFVIFVLGEDYRVVIRGKRLAKPTAIRTAIVHLVSTVWALQKGDILHVDRPNIILEKNENNNSFIISSVCP